MKRPPPDTTSAVRAVTAVLALVPRLRWAVRCLHCKLTPFPVPMLSCLGGCHCARPTLQGPEARLWHPSTSRVAAGQPCGGWGGGVGDAAPEGAVEAGGPGPLVTVDMGQGGQRLSLGCGHRTGARPRPPSSGVSAVVPRSRRVVGPMVLVARQRWVCPAENRGPRLVVSAFQTTCWWVWPMPSVGTACAETVRSEEGDT